MSITLGDMEVIERPADPKFIKALAVIASAMHPAYDALLPMPGKSKESCVLCSLTARDFLWSVGFKDAKVTTVYLMLWAVDAEGNEVHSAGVGDHLAQRVPSRVPLPVETQGRWNGHMVVEVPSAGYIIDTTLFPMNRPQWPLLPGMVAAPIEPAGALTSYGLEHISTVASNQGNGNVLRAGWLREPNPSWRGAPDTRRELREPVVKRLRQTFGIWRG